MPVNFESERYQVIERPMQHFIGRFSGPALDYHTTVDVVMFPNAFTVITFPLAVVTRWDNGGNDSDTDTYLLDVTGACISHTLERFRPPYGLEPVETDRSIKRLLSYKDRLLAAENMSDVMKAWLGLAFNHTDSEDQPDVVIQDSQLQS